MATRQRFNRAPRRKTFWLGCSSTLSADPEGVSEEGSTSGDLDFGTDNTPYDHDPTPTLVRIIGQLIVRANRVGIETANQTQEMLWSWGMSVQERLTGQDVLDYDDPIHLGDERIIVTKHGVVTAQAVNRPYWDGNTVEAYLKVEHTGQYPYIIDIDVRAQRKFEETTKIVAGATWFTPSNLDPFGPASWRFMGRALFKAS